MMSFLLAGLVVSASAQTEAPKPDYKKRPTLAVNLVFNDFTTAARIRSSSLSSVLNGKDWARLSDMNAGLSLQYLQGLSDLVDFSTRLDASFVKYNYRNMPEQKNDESLLLEADASVNAKLLTDNYIVVPYATAGVGATMYKNRFGAFVPLGVGLQFNLGNEDAFLFTSMQYRVPVSNWVNYHLNYSIGFASALTEKKAPVVAPPPPAPVEVDTDGDGIVDSKDKCPSVKGVAKYEGCPVPDTDGDGINDENDKCPSVKGLAKYQGCPIPDTDGDGVNDEEDKCPSVAGLAKYQGCPIPDTDNDGVNDEEDKCPNEAGPASNNGCPTKAQVNQPKVEMAAKNIFFATGSTVLLKKSYPALNDVAKLLKENADLHLEVAGHTDNTGSDKLNNKLSQSRADAVVKYLKSKGVKATQMTAKGYGASQPIADNNTKEGKAQNRRVELKLSDK